MSYISGRMRRLIVLALIAAGCSAPKRSPPTTPRDASVALADGGASPGKDAEVGSNDASTTPDAGRLDASTPDGATPDAGGICEDGPRKPPAPARSNVINGTRQPTVVPLSPAQVNAVVGLGYATGGAWCSGTLIAESTVLTATHCTMGEDPSALRVFFGEDDLNPDLTVNVAAKLEHPTRDMTLLTLAIDPSTQIAVQPIPIYLGMLSGADEGIFLEQAGFGDTESTTHGRFFVTEVLASVRASSFTVDGMGMQGVCYGDSGGPSMIVAPEGDARVLGDLSEGDAECAHQDDYIRTDAQRSWIENVTGPTPGAGPIPCGMVTSEGLCKNSGSTESHCEGGELVTNDCANGEGCGWSAAGWRCMPLAGDPCEGLAHFGTCNGEVARWCDRGVIYERDCEACGEHCLFLGERIGSDCDPDPLDCGELDYQGHCLGDVSEWCEDHERQRVDCAAMGQVCRFVDPTTGYYCDDP